MNILLGLPEQIDVAARIGLILVAAVLMAELGERLLKLPRLTGYVLAGMLFGAAGFGWLPVSITGDLRPVMLLGLGLLLFELGSQVDLRWLRANPWLMASSLTESGLTFAAVYFFLHAFGYPPATSVPVAAIAVATSPAVVMRIVAENSARGQLTQRLLLLTALNTLCAILLLKIALALIHLHQNAPWIDAIRHPVYVASGSFLLAVLLAYGVHRICFSGLRRESERFGLLLGLLLLATNAADHFGFSVPMALLCGGMLLRSWSKRLHLFPEHWGSAGAVLVVLLFALTGVSLDPAAVWSGGAMSLGLLAVRGLAKYAGGWVSVRRGGLLPRKAAWLGVALLPMSSLAVLQAYDVSGLYPDFGDDIMSIVLGAVLVMDLLGPLVVQLALRRAGESAEVRGKHAS